MPEPAIEPVFVGPNREVRLLQTTITDSDYIGPISGSKGERGTGFALIPLDAEPALGSVSWPTRGHYQGYTRVREGVLAPGWFVVDLEDRTCYLNRADRADTDFIDVDWAVKNYGIIRLSDKES